MIGLDTNIVLRLVDDAAVDQRELVLEYLEEFNHEIFFVNHVTLVEFVWVMKNTFKFDKIKILKSLNLLIRIENIQLENNDQVYKALSIYEKSKADFADCLIAIKNEMQDCLFTLTFDKKAFNSLPSHFKSLTH
jgi:predicted nucleic-acid-binding protein